jgi:hypothetical protein
VTEAAPEISKEESRALWLDVILWPLKGGMLGGVLLLAAMAAGLGFLEGGATQSDRDTRAYLAGALSVVALLTLGHYAWRAIVCTSPAERPVPWFGDDADASSLMQRVSTFLGVFAIAFLPLIVWVTAQSQIGAPRWVFWLVVVALSAAGAAVFPLGLSSSVVVGSALGAKPTRIWRMWKANPPAARIAATSALVFVGVFVAAALLTAAFVAKPKEIDYLASPNRPASDPVGPALRWSLIVLRAGGFYAALVSCRVAGLLVREVPEIREVVS